jgi:hypothetical protein
MTKDEDQIIKAALSAFGPDESVTFTQDTWAKLHAAMSAVVAQTAPVQEPVAWVGLTDEEIYKIDCLLITDITELVIAIESKLKEKNGV